MKTLSAVAKELGVSLTTVSFVYHGKWRQHRIRPDLAQRVERKLREAGARPDALGRQLQSGSTQTVGVILPHLDQSYFLKLLAGIERRLGEAGYMVVLASARWQWESRQVEILERMLERRVDSLLMAPRPTDDLTTFLRAMRDRIAAPLVFFDNYLPEYPAHRVVSDNRWGAREAVRAMLRQERRKIVFFGADPRIAALNDRYFGYCDAMEEAGRKRPKPHTIWRAGRERAAIDSLRSLFRGAHRPDGIFATSFLGFLPVLQVLDELGLRHPDDVLLAGFDEPQENWAEDTVRRVIKEPLLAVIQAASEMGQAAADLALAASSGKEMARQERLIRPLLSWRCDPEPDKLSDSREWESTPGGRS